MYVATLGERIRLARGSLSQERLAELAGISRVTLARAETDKQAPSADALWRIARATGRSTDWFHEGQDAAAPAPLPAKSQEPPSPPGTQAATPPGTQAHAPPLEERLARVEDALAALLAEQTETNRLLRQAIARGSGRATSGWMGNGDDPTVGSVA